MKSSYKFSFQATSLKYLGYFFWLILLLYSMYFYLERSTFMDGGFQIVELINSHNFGVYHYRMTNPLTQILPLIFTELGLPLKAILLAYSVNTLLFLFTIYVLITEWCKNIYLGWVQLLFLTLIVSDSFFFIPPEFYQGMSLLLLWWAILLQKNTETSSWTSIGLHLLLIPIIFDHTLLLCFFLFSWCFYLLHEKKYISWITYYSYLFMAILIYLTKAQFYTNWYDTI